MPKLKNEGHERYAQLRARGATIVSAYEDAGYKPDPGNGFRVDSLPQVRERIKEIKATIAQDKDIQIKELQAKLHEGEDPSIVTEQWMIIELLEALRIAKEKGNVSGVNKTLELLGKLTGLFPTGSGRSKSNPDGSAHKPRPAVDLSSLASLIGSDGGDSGEVDS